MIDHRLLRGTYVSLLRTDIAGLDQNAEQFGTIIERDGSYLLVHPEDILFPIELYPNEVKVIREAWTVTNSVRREHRRKLESKMNLPDMPTNEQGRNYRFIVTDKDGNNKLFARGYVRVVYGNNGPLIEFDSTHIKVNLQHPSWRKQFLLGQKSTRNSIRMVVPDVPHLKIDFQLKTSSNSIDLRRGMYYVNPYDLQLIDKPLLLRFGTYRTKDGMSHFGLFMSDTKENYADTVDAVNIINPSNKDLCEHIAKVYNMAVEKGIYG